MDFSRFRDMAFGRVYGRSAWVWASIVCLLVVGVALFPVPVAFTDDADTRNATNVGAFTDGAVNSSATVVYTVEGRYEGGLSVEENYDYLNDRTFPDVVWTGNREYERTERRVYAYDAERGVFYRSITFQDDDGRVWEETEWLEDGISTRRVEWPDGMRDADTYTGIEDNDTTVEVRDTGPTTTVIIRTDERVSAREAWENQASAWLWLSAPMPYVSQSGELVTGDGIESGSVQVSDGPGVAYEASFDYLELTAADKSAVDGLYGESYVPLVVRVLMPEHVVKGGVNRTDGASGIPEETPEWADASANASE